MPKVIQTSDQPVIVATSDYPYAKWQFEKFNPVQSRIMDFYDQDINGLIAAKTSAGKTVIAEMFLAQEIRKRGGKGMFLAPLRALAREKVTDWTNKNYHFKDQKISICTGDYRLTKERSKELNEADLIIMTSEMLNHRSRNYKSEQNNWLLDIGTVVIDESHLLTVPGRGDHLEVGLMKFAEINPNARLVLLSATMPNVEEIADWISYALTKKETFCLKSQYRPVPLTIHYEPYDDQGRYDEVEQEKINKAMDIVEWYAQDKFLVFAHTKRTGEMMKQALLEAGIEAEFHNADLEANERAKVEDRFKNDLKLRVIVATSTLAWGLNLPARRVLILGVHRGLSEVESHDIIQMVGRSGRLGIDPMGDAYILVPESLQHMYRAKFNKPDRIESQLLEKNGEHHKVLAFHLVSEIYHGDVTTTDDIHAWYKRSLAYFQSKELEDKVVDDTLNLLKKKGAIWQDENEEWSCRPIGKVSSLFYFSPFDASDLYYNFKNLFENNQENNDYFISVALGNTDTFRGNVVSRVEKDEMSIYANKVRQMMPGIFLNDAAIKSSFCYYSLLSGTSTIAFSAMQRNLQQDFERVSQVLQSLDGYSQFAPKGFFKNLEGRLVNGVPGYLVDLCQLPNIGKVRAKKLYENGIKSVSDIAKLDADKLRKLLNMKPDKVSEILKEATRINVL